MIPFLAILSIYAASTLRIESDFYGHRMYLSLALASVWVAGIVYKRVHWSAGLALGWMLLSAVYIFGNPVSPYIAEGDLAVMAFDSLSAVSFISILLVVVLLVCSKSRMVRRLLDIFAWLCILDSWFVVIQWVLNHSSVDRGGFFGNASMNACIIAFTYPVLKRQKVHVQSAIEAFSGLVSLVLPVLAVLVSRSNMAVAALIGAFLAPCIIKPFRRGHAFAPLIPVGLLMLGGLYFLGDKFGNSSGRWIVWKAAMQWWWVHANHWIGTGLGSYFVFGPNVQIKELHQSTSFLLWMHNDWLQILFEQGIIGLALFIVMTAIAISTAVKANRPWLVSSIAAFTITMCGNFPMHLPVPGFFGALLILIAFENASMPMRHTEKAKS